MDGEEGSRLRAEQRAWYCARSSLGVLGALLQARLFVDNLKRFGKIYLHDTVGLDNRAVEGSRPSFWEARCMM